MKFDTGEVHTSEAMDNAAIIPKSDQAARTRASMKGWELYVWKQDGDTLFSLLVGTNRLKTEEEISRAAVRGFDAIKPKLDTLKEGQYVLVHGRRFNERASEEQAKAAAEYCRELGLKVHVSK